MQFKLTVIGCLFSLSMVSINGWADANAGLKQCAQEKVAFDGIEPLKYADITGESNSHIPLLHQHPSLCASADEEKCKGKAYLLPGDTVAIANICGDYAHVQFIGEKTVSYGWVEIHQLISRALTKSDGDSKKFSFKLQKGRGTPVCEAYLQRLNTVDYYEEGSESLLDAPYCGRPESDAVPGFSLLKRVPLNAERANSLLGDVFNFTHPTLMPMPPEAHESALTKTPDGRLFIWRYDPPVDIDNDGTSDDVLIWQGYGAEAGKGLCGIAYRNNVVHQTPQIAYILTADGASIDQNRTQEIFGDPIGGYQIPAARYLNAEHKWVMSEPKFVKGFRPLGTSFGIYRYRNVFYFDTLSGNYNFSLFIHKDKKTQEICRVFMNDVVSGDAREMSFP